MPSKEVIFFKVWANEKGTASIVSSYPPEVLNYLVQKITVTISDIRGAEILKEERSANFVPRLKSRQPITSRTWQRLLFS